MFLRRQDVIDRFEANFRSDEKGQLYYWPRKAEVGLPISHDEYDAVMQAFERKHVVGMALMWIVMAVALGHGFYQLFVHDSFAGAGLSILAGFVFSTLYQTRDQLGLLLPFGQRLREYVKVRDIAPR